MHRAHDTFRRRTLLGALAILLGAGLGLAETGELRTQTLRGASLLEAGRLEQAEKLLSGVLEAQPSSVNANRNLALVHAGLGQRALVEQQGERALDAYDAALRLHPGRLRYVQGRAEALFQLGRHADALREAEAITDRLPTWLPPHVLMADVHERDGAYRDALEAVEAMTPLMVSARERQSLARRRQRLQAHLEIEETFLTDQTSNFTIRYDDSIGADTLALVRQLLEDAYQKVTGELGLTPRTAARVVLYADEDFSAIRGGTTWAGALYDNGTLRLPAKNLSRYRDTAARILAHEFTHHVLRENTPHLPLYWHEGVAQWQERVLASARVQRIDLAALAADERLLSPVQLRSIRPTALGTFTARLYYAQSLAFIEWLANEYGRTSIGGVLLALGTSRDLDAALKKELGRTEDALFEAWVASLR